MKTAQLSDGMHGFLKSLKIEEELSSVDAALRFVSSVYMQCKEKRMLVITGGNPVVVVREGK